MLMTYGIGRAVRRIRDKAKQAGKLTGCSIIRDAQIFLGFNPDKGQLEQQAEELMRQWAAMKEKRKWMLHHTKYP